MNKTKKQNGGKRPGAGRPKLANARVHITAKVLPETKAKIDFNRGESSVGKFIDFMTSVFSI